MPMRLAAPFKANDLVWLNGLYQMADVVSMEDIYHGANDPQIDVSAPTTIGLRHDCDNVIHPAVALARWEEYHQVFATYYVLHSAPYWQDKKLLRESLETIAGLGHEIGIHNDALTVALQTGRDPADILHEAIDELRGYGHTIRSTVAHGHHLCRVAHYVNDEMFDGCERPDYGKPGRWLEYRGQRVQIPWMKLSEFGLDFDANWLPRGDYLSDSGGHWSQPFDEVANAWPSRGQLHILQHPDWWAEAFEQVAA